METGLYIPKHTEEHEGVAVDLTRPSVWIKGVAAFWRHDKTREAIGVLAMATAVLC
ncbi:MAG: hypothetical protein H6Q87_1943, partial [candidate division NC10 bacterium]|nr:hypothetical protein [candidate division NC10 bacterium]